MRVTKMAAPKPDQAYDRVISRGLMEALKGPLSSLLVFRAEDPWLRDLQLRREPRSGTTSWCSLYLGLTSVLDVKERKGKFWLDAHATHRKRGHFHEDWAKPQPLEQLEAAWEAVNDYLARVSGCVDARWLNSEGRVHALISNSPDTGLGIINREASQCFRDTPKREELYATWRHPLLSSLADSDDGSQWWQNMRATNFGSAPDFVAVDAKGRLLVIEAKPANATSGIARGPVQVAFYAAMWAAWLAGPQGDPDVLESELAQRIELGLNSPGSPQTLTRPATTVPVLAIGPGSVSKDAWTRLRTVAVTVSHNPLLAPLEVIVLDADGVPSWWDWRSGDDPPPTSNEHTSRLAFSLRARLHATDWARQKLGVEGEDGMRQSCILPPGQAAKNLLPEAEGALELFRRRQLHWHQGKGGEPTANLVSSQVQCVNALYPLAQSEERVREAFPNLAIASLEDIVDGSRITFEYPGPQDERPAGVMSGTPVDAAFRYVDVDGRQGLALIEWKYVERYATGPKSREAYRAGWDDPSGPFRTRERGEGPLTYEDVLAEPFYQLMRQQLLAHQLEEAGTADLVTVVHVSPTANREFHRSLTLPNHHAAGTEVFEVWRKVLRCPERLITIDSAVLLNPGITSQAYAERYGHT